MEGTKGPKPIHHKNKNLIGLGRTIANQRSKENSIQYLPDGEMRFTTDKRRPTVKLRSVTQENALDEFLVPLSWPILILLLIKINK